MSFEVDARKHLILFNINKEDEEKGCMQLSRWQAPQRVFTNISGTHIDFCDYMFADEKAQVCLFILNWFLNGSFIVGRFEDPKWNSYH